MKEKIAVIIPALNEEESIELVIGDIPNYLSSRIIVVDNGSTDETATKARKKGAILIEEPDRGYGRACLAGLKYLERIPPSIVVFLDADYSDDVSSMPNLIQPIMDGMADLVLGSRISKRGLNALPFHVLVANRFFSWMINKLYSLNLTDLGPFRAIRWDTLEVLDMGSKTFGWSAEMIVKAARTNAKIVEIPVKFRKRIGKSKISGSVLGSLKAAFHIFLNILRYY